MEVKKLRKSEEIDGISCEKCHDGDGTLICRSLLDGFDSKKISFMHHDIIPNGVSIGEHMHEDSEEIYYLMAGEGILNFDGEEYPFNAGDISLVTPGHSHGFKTTSKEDAVLIVVRPKNN